MGNLMKFTLGLDLAQQSFDAAIAPAGADPKNWRDLPHSHIDAPADSAEGIRSLKQWLEATAAGGGHCERIIVESTGTISRRAAAALAQAQVGQVAIVNPRRSKAFGDSLGVRDKSDRIDCAILALYGLIHAPAPTRLRAAEDEAIRELNRLRESLVADRTAWLARLSEATGAQARRTIGVTIRHLERQIERIEKQIDKMLAEQITLQAQVKSLMQIPGIGRVTARTLTAELGDLRVYTRNQLVALAGLFPKEFSSGKSVHRRPRLAKGGGGRLRRVLYMGATSLFRPTSALWGWIREKLDQGRAPMVVEAMVMRKILLVARAVMVAGGHYDPSMIGAKEIANA
jgi:transposase